MGTSPGKNLKQGFLQRQTLNAIRTLQGFCRKSPFLWEGKLNEVLGKRSPCQAWPKIAVIGPFSPRLVFARQLQGGSQQTHQWAAEMMNYKRMAGLSDLLQGKHPEWIHLHHSKADMVEVPVGDGVTLGTAGGTDHGMITAPAPAWGVSPQLSQLLKQMETSQVSGLMSASADEGFSSLSPHRSQDEIVPFPVGLCHTAKLTVPRLGHRSGHSQPTEPSLQLPWHTRGKASLPIPAGCPTAANQEKVTKQTQFCFLIWKSICLQQNCWQINSMKTFHFGSEAPVVDTIELFIQISTQYLN